MCIDARWLYIYILYLSNICNFKNMLRQCTMASFPRSPHPPTPPWSCATWNLQGPPFPGWKSHVMIWRPDFLGQFSWATTIPYCLGLKIIDPQTCSSSYGWRNDQICGPRVPQGRKWLFANSPLPPSFSLTFIFWPNSPNVRWPIPRSHSSKPSDNWPSKT